MFHPVKEPYTLWYVTGACVLRPVTITHENDPLLVKHILRDINGLQWHPLDLHKYKEVAVQYASAYCTQQLARPDLTTHYRKQVLESQVKLQALKVEVDDV